MELWKLLKRKNIKSCTIKDGICTVQYISKEIKFADISDMNVKEVIRFIFGGPHG